MSTSPLPADRRAVVRAWAIAAVAYLVAAFAVVLAIANGPAMRNTDLLGAFIQAIVPSISIAAAGGLIASRQPRNPIGWLLLFGALCTALQGFAAQYVVHTLLVDKGSLPAVEWVAWFGSTVGSLVYPATIVLILLLFPDGRLPSARWRPVLWLDIALAFTNDALGFLDPAPIQSAGVPSVPNPLLLAHIKELRDGAAGLLRVPRRSRRGARRRGVTVGQATTSRG